MRYRKIFYFAIITAVVATGLWGVALSFDMNNPEKRSEFDRVAPKQEVHAAAGEKVQLAPAPPPATTNEATSKTISGLRLSVSVSKTVTQGTEFPLNVTLENSGDVTAKFFNRSNEAPVKFSITELDGATVPTTLFGKREFGPFDWTNATRLTTSRPSLDWRRISPGGTACVVVPNVGLYYDLTLPGEYLITVSKRVTVGGEALEAIDLIAGSKPETVGEEAKRQTIELSAGPLQFRVIASEFLDGSVLKKY